MKKIMIILFVFINSCSPPRIFINSMYDSVNLSNKVFAVWPQVAQRLEGEFNIVDDSFQNNCFKAIQNEINNKNTKLRISISNKLPSEMDLQNNDYFVYSKPISKNDTEIVTFSIPKPNVLNIYQNRPDLLLIIKDIMFDKKSSSLSATVMVPTGGLMTSGGGELPYLNAKVRFIIWNYIDNQPVVFGEEDVSANFLIKVNNKTYNSIFAQIAHVLLSKTPFPLASPETIMKNNYDH